MEAKEGGGEGEDGCALINLVFESWDFKIL